MDKDRGMISQYQSITLYVLIFFSPCIRYIPSFTSSVAGRAAWMSIIPMIFIGLLYLYVWNSIMAKYKSISYLNIMKDILGSKIGSICGYIFFIWITIMLAYNVRVYAERILSTATPNINMILLVGMFFLVSFYILKSGIVVLARMSEIFSIIMIVIFFASCVMVAPNIDVTNYFPITYKDIFPAFKGSLGIITIWSYISILFIYYDKVLVREKFKSLNFKLYLFLIIISLLTILIPLGVFGETVLSKMPIPFLSSIMEISFFETIERIDAGIIVFWIITDFMLTALFTYSAMHLVKEEFEIENIRPITSIYLLFVFFLTLIIAKSNFELTSLSTNILTAMNIIIGFIIPFAIFIVGKIRKKI